MSHAHYAAAALERAERERDAEGPTTVADVLGRARRLPAPPETETSEGALRPGDIVCFRGVVYVLRYVSQRPFPPHELIATINHPVGDQPNIPAAMFRVPALRRQALGEAGHELELTVPARQCTLVERPRFADGQAVAWSAAVGTAATVVSDVGSDTVRLVYSTRHLLQGGGAIRHRREGDVPRVGLVLENFILFNRRGPT